MIHQVQYNCYNDLIKFTSEGKNRSLKGQLDHFLDNKKLLCRARLVIASLQYSTKYLNENFHDKLLHAGTSHM